MMPYPSSVNIHLANYVPLIMRNRRTSMSAIPCLEARLMKETGIPDGCGYSYSLLAYTLPARVDLQYRRLEVYDLLSRSRGQGIACRHRRDDRPTAGRPELGLSPVGIGRQVHWQLGLNALTSKACCLSSTSNERLSSTQFLARAYSFSSPKICRLSRTSTM